MEEFVESVEIRVKPIPPQVLSSSKDELMRLLEEELERTGKRELLDEGQIEIHQEKTFPIEGEVQEED